MISLKKTVLKDISIAMVLSLLFSLAAAFSHFNTACEDMRANVLRLHIIANSDSGEDQAIKLAVRDAILESSKEIFKESNDLDSAIACAGKSLPYITDIANGVLKSGGFSYMANAVIGDSYFETREYDDFTLPAGTYKSLIVRLGKSAGHNWWCVIYPGVCLSCASNAKLEDSVKKTSADIAKNSKKYVMRFKSVEIYEDIKKKFSGK